MHYLNYDKHIVVIEDLSSNKYYGCPWMQIHMLYLDPQYIYYGFEHIDIYQTQFCEVGEAHIDCVYGCILRAQAL